MSVSRVLRASRAVRAHVRCKRLVFYIALLNSANVIPKLIFPHARPLVQWQNNQLADCGNWLEEEQKMPSSIDGSIMFLLVRRLSPQEGREESLFSWFDELYCLNVSSQCRSVWPGKRPDFRNVVFRSVYREEGLATCRVERREEKRRWAWHETVNGKQPMILYWQ